VGRREDLIDPHIRPGETDMERREVLGVAWGLGLSTFWPGTPRVARGADLQSPSRPARLSVEELAQRVGAKGFDPESLYAHELEFRGVVLIRREVPLLRIKDMTGRFGYNKVHLYGSGGNVDVGAELIVTGLIVDHGYGALMIWQRECKYADA
jgi:hypothetical protein